MKRMMLIVCGIFAMTQIPLLSDAQPANYSYRPLVKDGKLWKYNSMDGEFSYYLQGDTTINDMMYLKLWEKNERVFADTVWHYCAALREEDRRVYSVMDKQEKDTLVYDFTLKRGEQWCVVPESYWRTLCEICYGYVREELFKMIGYSVSIKQDDGTILHSMGASSHAIEGVGSMNDLIHHPWAGKGWDNDFACYEDGKLLFSHADIYTFLESHLSAKSVIIFDDVPRSSLFDLQGRRLNAVPTRGMYIKDGRKYVK